MNNSFQEVNLSYYSAKRQSSRNYPPSRGLLSARSMGGVTSHAVPRLDLHESRIEESRIDEIEENDTLDSVRTI